MVKSVQAELSHLGVLWNEVSIYCHVVEAHVLNRQRHVRAVAHYLKKEFFE
jgi:hypothetical protein